MQRSLTHALVDNFLGNSPYWYKLTIIFFLIAEPHGLARLWQIGKEKLRLWPFPH